MKPILSLVGVAALCAPTFAQVHIDMPIPTPPRVIVRPTVPPRASVVVVPPEVRYRQPAIHFGTPPPLIEVRPGVRVVRDFDQEVFFVDGYYWAHGPGSWWYRARDYRGGWEPVDARWAPASLSGMPRGHYVRHRGPSYWDYQRRAR